MSVPISSTKQQPLILRYKEFVMEEQERKEEAMGRWKEIRDCGTDDATLPVRQRHWIPLQNRVTTTAILEGARDILSDNGPKMNGVYPSGGDEEHTPCNNQNESNDKPPKLVVNLNHSDKASQIPEPFPSPEKESDLKKIDEPDGEPEQEDNCAVDCLYVTLQCCDCSLM